MEYEDSLGDNYTVIERLGSGGQASVYLVREINSGIEYVAKLIKNLKYLNNEILLNQAISTINPPSPYIIRYFINGHANFTRNGELFENVPYLIFENAPKGDLYQYIKITGGFG